MSRKLRNTFAQGIGEPVNTEATVDAVLTPIEKSTRTKTSRTKKAAKQSEEEGTEGEDGDEGGLEKSDEEEGVMVTLQKDVSGAIQSARRAAGVSEQVVADALGVDLDSYIDFEENGGELDITEEGFNKLAKAFKMTPGALATKMLSTPAPGTPATSEGDNVPSGDENQPPAGDLAKSKVKGEKQLIKSAQIRTIRVTDPIPNADLADMDIEKRKHHAFKRFTKSLFSEQAYRQIEKGGLITADMFGPNTSIDPVIANTLVNVFVDESQYLKQVQVKPMTGKKQNVNVMDVPSRTATRLTSNVWPDSTVGTNPINLSLQMDAEKIHFSWIVDDDTLMTYRGNLPGLEAELTGAFTRALSNDVWDLGLNGLGGTYAGAWTALNKGWLALLKSGADSGTGGIAAAMPAGQLVDISVGGYTTVQATLAAMLSAAYSNGNERFFDDTTPFLMGPADWQAHKGQMTSAHPTFPIPITGLEKQYEGHPINVTNKLAASNILLTAMQNLVLGIVTGMPGAGGDGFSIERFRVVNATRFVATVYLDYGVVNAKAAVVAQA